MANLSCGQCGENRFDNAAQLNCHGVKNHMTFSCSCGTKFMTIDEKYKHDTDMKNNEKEYKCTCCCRSFNCAESRFEHQRAKDHWQTGEKAKAYEATGKAFCDDKCGKRFNTTDALQQHQKDIRAKYGIDPTSCIPCRRDFNSADALNQHNHDKGHNVKNTPSDPNRLRRAYVDGFYKDKVAMDKSDKKESVKTVKDTMDTLMKHVRQQPGGKIYSPDVRKAGSNAVKVKIGKADEFDTNVPLHIDNKEVLTKGPLKHMYANTPPGGPSPNNLNVKRNIVPVTPGDKVIPYGFARITVGDQVPANLTHGGDLIAHKVKRDLYDKMCYAKKELGMDNVHISRNSHGPAVTLTITTGGHDINVDVTPSVRSNIKVTENGWPRPDTKKAFPADTIDKLMESNIHLVPKGDVPWAISYSNAEKDLLTGIDQGNGCRRHVLKCLKKEVQDATSRSPDGLPGISSHIIKENGRYDMTVETAKIQPSLRIRAVSPEPLLLASQTEYIQETLAIKHSVLWCAEKQHEPDYWHQKNVDTCLMYGMKHTEDALRRGKLPDYFNTGVDILRGKDPSVMNRLADDFKNARIKLAHI